MKADVNSYNEVLSLFDSGNINKYDIAELQRANSPTLIITFSSRADPSPSTANPSANQHRSWFNFLVHNSVGFEAAILTFQWINAPSVRTLIKNGYRPVYRSISRAYNSLIHAISQAEATGVADYSIMLPAHKQLPFKYVEFECFTNASHSFLGFSIRIPKGTTCIQVAFTFPYPLNEIYFRMQELKSCYPIREEKITDETILYRIARYQGLPILYISARCHPGEAPGSYVLDGILDNISRLLHWFEIWIIPAINAEGIRLGYYRTDKHGNDLNRCYTKDSPLVTGKIISRIISQGTNAGMLLPSSEKLLNAFQRICSTPPFKKFSSPTLPADIASSDDLSYLIYPTQTPKSVSLAKSTIVFPPNEQSKESVLSPERYPSYFTDSIVASSDLLRASFVDQMPLSLSTTFATKIEQDWRASSENSKEIIHTIVISPDPPAKYPLKQCIIFCLDIHAHASIPNCFLLGNSHLGSNSPEFNSILDCSMAELRSLLFPMILESRIKYFDTLRSDFSLSSMRRQDKSGSSFSNTMRVGLYELTKLPNIYCFETHYFRQTKTTKSKLLTVSDFNAMGREIVSSIESYFMLDPSFTLTVLRKLELNANRLNIDGRLYVLLKELKARLGKDYFACIYKLMFDQFDYQCCGIIRRRLCS